MCCFAHRPRSSIWIILVLVSITALAAGLRFFQIDRLPPGLSYDEAWNDRQALRVVQGRAYPVYFVDEWGDVEEPLHIYLIAGLFALAGPHAIGGRLVSVLLGTLTIPLLFFAGREMLRANSPAFPKADPSLRLRAAQGFRASDDVIALLAAFVLATFYWHVHYTRLGMEPPAVPALATLTFWLLWRAFNRGGWLDYALAGGALGLSLYTHPSARFMPIVVAVFIAWRWAGDRTLIRRELGHLGLLVASATIAFAPLGWFFLQNPDLFFYRAGQASVVTFSGGLAPVLENAGQVIGGLFWRGDTNLRLNLPGRPGLDIVQSLLLVAGTVYALGRERRRILVFPLLWAGIMILPSVFSDAAPHFGRMLGATPAIAILIALGCMQIFRLGSEIRNPLTPQKTAGPEKEPPKSDIRRSAQVTIVVMLAGAMGYSTVRMAHDYFVAWARDPGLYTAFDVGLRQSAEYLARLPGDELISLSPVDRNLPVFRFTFRDDVSRLKTFNGRRCAVYPVQPEHDFTHVAIVAQETNSLKAVQRAFPSGQVAQKFFDAGTPYAVAYHVRAGTRAQTPQGELAVFGDRIVLVDTQTLGVSETPKVLRIGDTLPITLTWSSHAALDVNYTIFVHLAPALDAPPIAQEDAQPCDNSYPTTWWAPGEIIEENHGIVIPPNTLPGQYLLTTGIYDLATGKRLPMHSSYAPPGDRFILGTVMVTR